MRRQLLFLRPDSIFHLWEKTQVNARDWALYGSKNALQDVSKALSQIQDSITEINED
jgi:hypothetical protein